MVLLLVLTVLNATLRIITKMVLLFYTRPSMNLRTKKSNGVIFKIDFEKAHDKVKWSYLQQTLRMKGFSPKWCRWIQNMVSGGSVGMKVNDDIGPYFQTKQGLRQGVLCPLSYLTLSLTC
jgi:hypothetical protein